MYVVIAMALYCLTCTEAAIELDDDDRDVENFVQDGNVDEKVSTAEERTKTVKKTAKEVRCANSLFYRQFHFFTFMLFFFQSNNLPMAHNCASYA